MPRLRLTPAEPIADGIGRLPSHISRPRPPSLLPNHLSGFSRKQAFFKKMSTALSIDSGPNTLSYRVVSTLATLLGEPRPTSRFGSLLLTIPGAGTCIVSFCLGQRTYTFDVFSRRGMFPSISRRFLVIASPTTLGLSSMTVSRFWLLFLLIDS